LLGGNVLLALIGVFVFFGANGEAQMVRQRELTRGLSVSDVMAPSPAPKPSRPTTPSGRFLTRSSTATRRTSPSWTRAGGSLA
jgi:hypothetical protein